jgi:DNA-binding MarR family transcriptional regulator
MPPGMRDDFQNYGLGPRHGAVLTQLLADSPLTVSELASRLGVSLPTASEVVADLVASDWVLRTTDPSNRRRTLLSLNPRHKKQMTLYADVRTAPLAGALRRLSPTERAGFMAGLRAWVRETNAG